MIESKLIRIALIASLLGAALGGFAGCSRVQEPWDRTGHFEKDRARTEAQNTELRQRAREQADRTYG
jgi:hypothetical protein